MAEIWAGFTEIEHTADWALEVWGPDLPALLEQAGDDRWAAEGATTVGERVRARLADLLATGRPFRLTADQEARLEELLAETLADADVRI